MKRKYNKKQKKENTIKALRNKKTLAQKINVSDEVLHFSAAALLFFLFIFMIAASFGAAGKVGDFLYENLEKVFGVGYYLIPISFFMLATSFIKDIKKQFTKIKFFGILLFVTSGLGFIDIVFEKGGYLGSIISETQNFLGTGMSIVLSLVMLIISQVIIFDGIPKFKKKEEKEEHLEEVLEQKSLGTPIKSNETGFFGNKKNTPPEDMEQKIEEKKVFTISGFEKKSSLNEGEKMSEKIQEKNDYGDKIILPPINLLSKDKGKSDAGNVEENAHIIKSTLASFGIEVEIESVAVGPTVTRYSLRPKVGVRVSKISALADDLALALAAKSILIQTPIPGESLVGIEIPNRNKTMVGAGGMFSSPDFINSQFSLPIAIGKDISGKTVVVGMETTPHMLIAGATGSGKSVTVHTIINSLLYKHGPDTLKLILIDPKRVEMTLYNGIPHLLTPVITDPKKAILSLRWTVNEMERRYEVLEGHELRDITSYHKNILNKAKENKQAGKIEAEDMPEGMPYIVVIIDELADIMQQYPKELESGIVSIAQKARAVGIHLVLSTQRPSVNVVTGLIKANVPTRLALQVSSAIDSKTILDQGGAEKLLGQGDMLYMLGNMAKPVRVQSAFISENEVKSVVKFIKNIYKSLLPEEILMESNEAQSAQEVSTFTDGISFDDDEDFDLDPLLKDAREEVITSGKASISYLQRKLGIGYARAAKLIDILEERGIVGPANGSKPREVLVGNRNNN